MLSSHRADAQTPIFRVDSKLAVARDLAIVLLCIAAIIGFLAELGRPAASRATAPPGAPADAAASSPGGVTATA